jgi:hypothetical protein
LRVAELNLFIRSEIIIPIADYSFALLLWTVLSLVKRHSRWAPLMLLGVALSITASLVQILKLKPSDSFNHNDLWAALLPNSCTFLLPPSCSLGLFCNIYPGTTSSSSSASWRSTCPAPRCAHKSPSHSSPGYVKLHSTAILSRSWTIAVVVESIASHVTRHTSHVTRHTSHVTRHTSHVTRHTSHVARCCRAAVTHGGLMLKCEGEKSERGSPRHNVHAIKQLTA